MIVLFRLQNNARNGEPISPAGFNSISVCIYKNFLGVHEGTRSNLKSWSPGTEKQKKRKFGRFYCFKKHWPASKERLDLCISLRSIDLYTSFRNKDNLLIASSFHVLSTTSDKIRLDARGMFQSLNFATSNVEKSTKENL